MSYEPMVHSGLLFSQPTFLTGVGRIFDFGQGMTQYNYSPTPEDADSLAIWSDWLAVGGDIHWALESFETQVPGSAK